MPILRLNAGPDGLSLHRSPASPRSALSTAATGTGPVIILIHGFKYDPDCTDRSPHATIFRRTPHQDNCNKTPWLQNLGFGIGRCDEGLAIAFGWRARGNLWRAQRSARLAGAQLADVIRTIRALAPHRPIHAITHSMGSEVIFEALHRLGSGDIDRIITLTGASYATRAEKALQTHAGQTAELLNVTSRENDVFDFMFERLIAPPSRGDRAMGVGIRAPNAVTIQLDCVRTLATLAHFGGHIARPHRRICHWSGYTRAGALHFYAHAMRNTDAVPLAALQHALPLAPKPRWSRMFAMPDAPVLLPWDKKAAS